MCVVLLPLTHRYVRSPTVKTRLSRLQLRGLAAAAVALAILAIVATSISIAQETSDSDSAANDTVKDPTAIPVAPNPTLIPLPHDQVGEPGRSTSPESVKRVSIPAPSEIKQGTDGLLEAAVEDGCVWKEIRRSVLPGRDKESVILETPCAPDRALILDPETGELRVMVRDY